MSFCSVQIYNRSCIHLHSSPTTIMIKNSQDDQPPDGVIAQLEEYCTGIEEVMFSFRPEFLFQA